MSNNLKENLHSALGSSGGAEDIPNDTRKSTLEDGEEKSPPSQLPGNKATFVTLAGLEAAAKHKNNNDTHACIGH
jgi:hypothetical protein